MSQKLPSILRVIANIKLIFSNIVILANKHCCTLLNIVKHFKAFKVGKPNLIVRFTG